MYKNFKREFDASIEALGKTNMSLESVCEVYLANLKDFVSRIREARRDDVLSRTELATLNNYMTSATELAAWAKTDSITKTSKL